MMMAKVNICSRRDIGIMHDPIQMLLFEQTQMSLEKILIGFIKEAPDNHDKHQKVKASDDVVNDRKEST